MYLFNTLFSFQCPFKQQVKHGYTRMSKKAQGVIGSYFLQYKVSFMVINFLAPHAIYKLTQKNVFVLKIITLCYALLKYILRSATSFFNGFIG
jgi:putative flippase GtrA